MTKEEALSILMKMRAWREWGREQIKEERPEMPEQKEVDEAFDICIEMLSNPSLPSNMATAAIHAAQNDMCDRQIMEDSDEHRILYSRVFRRGFKAGAEWMAEQGETIEGEVYGRVRDHINIKFPDGVGELLTPIGISHIPADVSKYNIGDKVVVQIKKK